MAKEGAKKRKGRFDHPEWASPICNDGQAIIQQFLPYVIPSWASLETLYGGWVNDQEMTGVNELMIHDYDNPYCVETS